MGDRHSVKPCKSIDLSAFKTNDTGPFKDKDEAAKEMGKNLEELSDLQAALYAEGERAVLVVLQGMDASGKDGTISHVFSGVNPQGCNVVSFKSPSHLELAHDYLWRVHEACPARGMITIFNRSHYESVLIERVQKLTPKEIWSRRYEHINAFEKLLSDEGTRVLKFFLHVSKDEQRQRLQERIDDPTKRWKYNPGDLDQRKLWDEYQNAYADAIARCSTGYAPWHIIPADRKWYRNWAISEAIVDALKEMKPKFPTPKLPEKTKVG